MVYEFLEVGPYNEAFVQMDWPSYNEAIRIIFNAVRKQIVRNQEQPELKESDFVLKCNQHDFGGYYVVEVDEELNDEHDIESQWPVYWDEESKAFLEKEFKEKLGETYSEYMLARDKEPFAERK